MTQTPKPNGKVELTTDRDHILHRIGSGEYSEIRRTIVPASDAGLYEEIPVGSIPMSESEYKARVVELIRRRYDADDETAILRQRDTKPEEFAEYNAYAEQCKAEVKAQR